MTTSMCVILIVGAACVGAAVGVIAMAALAMGKISDAQVRSMLDDYKEGTEDRDPPKE